MASETARYEPMGSLPAHRAFVVHFGSADRGRRRFAGRVEHLASGRSAQFASLRALRAFFVQLLDAPREP